MEKGTEVFIDWWPQPRQLACLAACGLDKPFTGQPLSPAIADIIGYGGSAGGGKTDTLLEIGQIAGLHYPKLNIGYFRREFPQLEGPGGAILRSMELFLPVGRYNEQKHRWNMVTKSIMQFCHCANPNDVYNYQSQQFDILLVDEVTQFTREMIKYLLTRNRGTVDYPTFKPFACFGTNPGNVGHGYFKEEFVEVGPPEQVNIYINEVGKPEKHVFIPSKLSDNQILVKRDPGYADRVGNTELNKKILLEGSWDVFAGQAFTELSRDVHLIEPFTIPSRWKKFAAYDHGYNHPFSFGIFAVDDDGVVYLVKRVKDRLKQEHEIAALMRDAAEEYGGMEALGAVHAGHDCWARGKKGEPSIAEDFLKLQELYPSLGLSKIILTQANIDRKQGVAQIRSYLTWKNKLKDSEGNLTDGTPRFYIFRPYSQVYDTMSQMLFDPHDAEDVLKVDADDQGVGGDDDYDMVRYGLMSRPHAAQPLERKAPKYSMQAFLEKKQRERELRREYVGW